MAETGFTQMELITATLTPFFSGTTWSSKPKFDLYLIESYELHLIVFQHLRILTGNKHLQIKLRRLQKYEY